MNEFIIESPLKDRSVPFYYQITKLLRRMIEQGELTPGEKLPTEIELSKTFGVSRVTLRQALSILKADGLLDRKQGNGTFVTKSHTSLERIKLTGIIEQNLTGEQAHRLISVEDIPPPPHLEEFFRISTRDRLTRIRRLRMVDDIPFCYTINFLAPKWAKKLKHRDMEHHNMLEITQSAFNFQSKKFSRISRLERRTAKSPVNCQLKFSIRCSTSKASRMDPNVLPSYIPRCTTRGIGTNTVSNCLATGNTSIHPNLRRQIPTKLEVFKNEVISRQSQYALPRRREGFSSSTFIIVEKMWIIFYSFFTSRSFSSCGDARIISGLQNPG
jgi:DNA-binding GntR family transcriptional regulator